MSAFFHLFKSGFGRLHVFSRENFADVLFDFFKQALGLKVFVFLQLLFYIGLDIADQFFNPPQIGPGHPGNFRQALGPGHKQHDQPDQGYFGEADIKHGSVSPMRKRPSPASAADKRKIGKQKTR